MTLDQLRDNITFIKKRHAQIDALNALLVEFNPELPSWFPADTEMETRLVNAWAKELVDVDGWLSYYIYELDCGDAYTEGDLEDVNGKPIPLRTVEDLWKLLKESAEPPKNSTLESL